MHTLARRGRLLSDREREYERVRDLVVRAVRLQQVESGTQQAAIADLHETDGLPERWLERLIRRQRDVTIHLSLYERLLSALDRLIEKHEARLAQEKAALAALRGGHAVVGASPEAHSRADGTGRDQGGA